METKWDKVKSQVKVLREKGFLHITISQIMVKLISFCNSIVLVRLLSKTDYGLYAYVANIISMFLLFDGLGTISGMLQFGSEYHANPSKQSAFISFGFKIGFISNILVSILIVIISMTVKLSLQNAQIILLIMAFQPIFSYLCSFGSINLRIHLENKKFSAINIVNAAITVALLILGAYFFGVKGVAFFQYIAYSAIIILLFFACQKHFKDNKNAEALEKNEKKSFLKISLSATLNESILHLIMIFDIFIIGILIADNLVIASYKTATTIPTALIFIPNSIMIFAYPYFARNNKNLGWLKKKYSLILIGLGILNALLVISLIALAPFIIKLIFGSQYLDAVPVFRILCLGYLIAGTFRTPSVNVLWALKQPKYILITAILTGIAHIGLDLLLIHFYGPIGAAVATVISYTFAAISSVICVILALRKANKMQGAENL